MKTAGTIISAHSTDARVWIEAHGQNQTEAEKLHALHAAAPMLAEALKRIMKNTTDEDIRRAELFGGESGQEAAAAFRFARHALAAAGVRS